MDGSFELTLHIAALGGIDHAPDEEPVELKLDFNTPTMGPMEITYLGDTPSVKILDHNEHLKEVPAKGEPKKVILKNMYAFPFNWVSLLRQASLLP